MTFKKNAQVMQWAMDLIALYESGSVNQFILYGNVNDRMLIPEGDSFRIGKLRDYLTRVLMEPFDVVLGYDVGNGIRIEKGGEIFATWWNTRNTPELPKLPKAAIETLTHYFRYVANLARLGKEAPQTGCIVDAAELIVPETNGGSSYDMSAMMILIRDWAHDSLIHNHAIATFLITENLNDIHKLLANNMHAGKIKVPLPDAENLRRGIELLRPGYGGVLGSFEDRLDTLSQQLVGATFSAVEQLIKTSKYKKETLQPDSLVNLKKNMVEQDYGGLIRFMESKKNLDYIHGHDKVKTWIRQDISLWNQNDLKAMPMGYLLCGPVGTGKTFFVECLAGEAGVPVVKMKNFRDKWVGSTEGNLEKIFRLLHALGRCIVFVDEADQALGRRDASASGDSNVSGRVYSMIAEEMSDTKNRGKILWILASSRPDLIEVDLKRPGRIDVKIPLFPTLTPEESFALIQALCKRLGIMPRDELFAEVRDMLPDMLTPGAAEALSIKIYRLARTRMIDEERAFKECIAHYQMPVPRDIMDFQIHLAVREASDLEFVPKELLP